MSEVEFDLLLDAVQTAIAPDFEEGFVAQSLPLRQPPPQAAPAPRLEVVEHRGPLDLADQRQRPPLHPGPAQHPY